MEIAAVRRTTADPVSSVASVAFPKSKAPSTTNANFQILLKNGDVLSGDLTSIDDQTFSFTSPRMGHFSVARKRILSLQKSHENSGMIYSGPRGLEGWQPAFRRPSQPVPIGVIDAFNGAMDPRLSDKPKKNRRPDRMD